MLQTSLPDFLRSSGSMTPGVQTTGFPRVRFTVQGMTLTVAAIALLLGGIKSGRCFLAARDFRQRAAFYSRIAVFLEEREREERSKAATWDYDSDEWKRKGWPMPPPGFYPNHWRGQADRDAQAAVYYERMRAKYERAATYPWITVEPDPIPPPP
jgi:hypothetical protein